MGVTILAFAFVTGVLIWAMDSGRGFALYGRMERSKEPISYWIALFILLALSCICLGVLMTHVLAGSPHEVATAQHVKGAVRSL